MIPSAADATAIDPPTSPVPVAVRGEGLVFGGLELDWLDGRGRPVREVVLPGAYAELVAERATVAAPRLRVRCRVREERGAEAGALGRAIRWSWAGARGTLATTWCEVALEQLGPDRFEGEATLRGSANGRGALLSALATALTERVGGLVLHATGVVLDGKAVLFVGPSGAGKTTSARHCAGCAWLTRDRAIVLPPSGEVGWQAWAAPGGDDVPLPWWGRVVAPLAGVLRVARGPGPSRVVALPRVSALLRVRECMQSGAASAADEAGALAAAARLLDEVPVAALEPRLGDALTPVVGAWLEAARPLRGARS